MAYQVKIPVFEGPLDLLLHLINENEVDIYNIPIAEITQQYLDYLALAEEMDLELTSEFLLMACTLLAIKAKMLLPKPLLMEEEEAGDDPREELVQKLLEYKQYKEKADSFREWEQKQARVFFREIDEAKLLKEFPPPNPLEGVTLDDLFSAFQQIVIKLEKKNQVVSILREEFTIQDKIIYIYEQLKMQPSGVSFRNLFRHSRSRDDVIVTFLALLELVRREQVQVVQTHLFADILIFLRRDEGGQASVHTVS